MAAPRRSRAVCVRPTRVPAVSLQRRTPLRRTGRIKARAHPDPVSPELWLEVVERDQRRCMAAVLDPIGHPPTACRGPYGQRGLVSAQVVVDEVTGKTISTTLLYDLSCLTVDHVPFPVHLVQRSKDDPARGTRRAPSRIENLLTLCHHANVNGWASAHRELERSHLATLYPEAWPDESG